MLVTITGKKNEEILTTTSRQVADKFGKRHDHILRDIEQIIHSMGHPQNWGNLFIETTYIHEQNKQKYKEYEITRDGFSLLAMGFTGEKALKWKLDYIKAFNEMEKELARIYEERKQWEIERAKGIIIRHMLTDTIKLRIADSPHKKFMYPNYTKLIYKTLFGKTMKELQEEYKVQSKKGIRDHLTAEQLKDIESLEMLVSSLLNCGWGYEQIKTFIQQNAIKQFAV